MSKFINDKSVRAFTMAEVILVMLVLGVILSILVRTIVRVDPDKDKYLFLKSYHAVEAVVADSMNDDSKYDQNIYSKAELKNWEGQKHFDFSFPPFETARVRYIDDGVEKIACASKDEKLPETCNEKITQANAICYYLVEHLNTIGPVNCDVNAELNFRTSIGVCFREWKDSDADGNFDAVIDPSCSGKANGYAVHVSKRGAVTIPETTTIEEIQNSGNQTKAYNWAKNPTVLND